MTDMADRTVRGGQERSRIKTLTQAALNADKTVEQVEDVLDGLSTTMKELSSSLSALNATVERLEAGLDHLDGTMTSLDDLAKRLIVLVEPVEAIVARVDDMVRVPDAASVATMRWVSERLGRRVGPSTGTNVWAALGLISDMHRRAEAGSVVTLLCDTGERYLSTYYDDGWLAERAIDLAPHLAALADFERTGVVPPV